MANMIADVDARTHLVGRNRLELLMFFLGSRQRFGINVFKVREVIERPPLTQTPDSHRYIRGMANIRGHVIHIMDLASAVGKPPIDINGKCHVIVTEYNRMINGFLVSGVEKIVNLNWENIKPPPTGLGSNSFLTAVTSVEDELVEILDVEKVLAEVMGYSDQVSEDKLDAAHGNDYRNEHVLVVDDSTMARKQIIRVLDQLGIPYTITTNGKEAYELLLDWARDLDVPISERCSMVLSDVEMPEMDGYTLTKKIKEHPDLKGLHVLLHSSLSGTFNQKMIEKVGADDFLPKYKPDELAERVSEYFKLRMQKVA